MADYCAQCVVALGVPAEKNDFAVPAHIRDQHTADAKFNALCEGCGFTIVDRDGRCLHAGSHPEEAQP